MNDNIILIPGWNGKFDINLLKMYKVSLNRKDIDVPVLNYYIKRGEYTSTFPLGILKLKEEYYLITCRDYFIKKTFFIKNYAGEIDDSLTYDIVYDKEALEAFFHSLIDSIFIREGFEKPIDIRTFLGKAAKGKLSDRRQVMKEFTIPNKIYDANLKIYKSINHQTFVNENLFFITCLPNYEIYGNFLDLPLSNDQKVRLEDEEEYKSTIFMTPDDFIRRFSEYKDSVLITLQNSKFIVKAQENQTQTASRLRRSDIFRVRSLNKNITIQNDSSFEIQMLEFFKENINDVHSISINLLIDKYQLDEDPLYSKRIEEYIIELKKVPFFTIKKIQNFELIEEISFVDNENYLILINDKSAGSKYIYDYCKKQNIISKVIKSNTTLNKISNFLDHILLIWLSFYYRIKRKLNWFKKNFSQYNRIVSFNVIIDINFNYIKLSGIILNLRDFSIEEIKQILFLPKNNVIKTSEISKAIIKSLKYDFKIPDNNDFYLFTKMQFTQDFINIFDNIAPVAVISQPFVRILSHKKDSFSIPDNGIFFKIFESNSLFLLITTGQPDYSGQGIPNPLLVEFNKKVKMEMNEISLIQLIYDLTFFQPLSFSKKSLPFLLTMNNKLLFNKIPLKFNEVEPF